MSVHVKKCWPEQFYFIRSGDKPFEWRKEDDCKYEVADLLVLLEYTPPDILDETTYGYTGEVEKRIVTYVLRGMFGMPAGYVVLGLRKP